MSEKENVWAEFCFAIAGLVVILGIKYASILDLIGLALREIAILVAILALGIGSLFLAGRKIKEQIVISFTVTKTTEPVLETKPEEPKPEELEPEETKPKDETPEPEIKEEEPEPEIRSTVQEFKHKVYDVEKLNYWEKDWLRNNRYDEHAFVLLGEIKQRNFMVALSEREGPLHVFLVWNACQLLRKAGIKNIQTFETVKPDIIFTKNKRKFAVEVETGTALKRDKKRIAVKAQTNNKEYGKNNWFFLTALSRQVKQYKKYGKSMSRNQFVRSVVALKRR